MNIPFLDLQASSILYQDEINDSIQSCINRSEFILGVSCSKFEDSYAKFVSSEWCVGVNSGFDALKLALLSCGINHGDEVIVPEHTFIATWQAVIEVGGIPVSCPIDTSTFLIDCNFIEPLITCKTKAIIPVHLYGNTCDLNVINEIASRHQLSVIEDAAQCHGAQYNNAYIGSHGNLVCWSFYPGKILGCYGDGGAITGFSNTQWHFLQSYRNYGSVIKYEHTSHGVNSRLDSIQASILSVKLKYLKEDVKKRRKLANLYNILLSEVPHVAIPLVQSQAYHAYHLYVIKCFERDSLVDYLKKAGISTLIHYPFYPHQYDHLSKFAPNIYQTENICNSILSLPIYPGLPTDHVRFVCKTIIDFYEN